MLLLPTILAKFVLSKDQCTQWQLYQEVMPLVLNGVLDEDAVSCVKEWCLAVGQTTNVTKVSPALSMKILPAPVMEPQFSPWKNHLLHAMIGPKPTGGGSPEQATDNSRVEVEPTRICCLNQ